MANGAGTLSISVHCAEVGLLYQLVTLALGTVLTWASIRPIARACVATRCWSYEDVCDELFHPAMSLLTSSVNVCNCLGAGAGNLIVCGQVFQGTCGAGESVRRAFFVGVGAFVCVPLALARHVNFMRYLALGSIAAFFGVVCRGRLVFGQGRPG